ncbi:conserved protein, unknown function [Hepatocystis sp. ex Piliocolobus tephrosceles]|nr:conserved protein, unknown function [Hepatocystis sp. ex Piliocolobus tephrosceles]
MNTHLVNTLSSELLIFFLFFFCFCLSFAEYNIKTQKLTFESNTEKCKISYDLFGLKNNFIIRNKDNVYMDIKDNQTIINNLKIYGTIHTNEYLYRQTKQWTMFHLDTFDLKTKMWTPSEISTCGDSTDTFLGGPCKLGANEAYTKITNLPKHNELKINLRIHFFDKWNNDSLYLQVDNKTIWAESYKSCFTEDCLHGIDICGKSTPDRLSYPINIEITHSSDNVNILIGSTLKKDTDACETSWGLDDFIIYYK